MLRCMARGVLVGLVLLGCGLVAGCGGGTAEPEMPDDAALAETPPPAPEPEPASETASADGETAAERGDAESKPKEGATGEPEFKEGMSVDEAIAAVPRDAQRMNLDGDALGKPLMDQKLYEPCKLAQNQKFKVRVAIWNGKAVGLDVTTQPNNARAKECIATQIRSVTWRDKVPSLNTV